MTVVTGSADVVATATVLPPDLLDEATRARLKDAASRPDPVVDARRWAKVVFLVMTLVIWFPTAWSGTKAAEASMQQWSAGIALTAGVYVVLATMNRFAKENAMSILRKDSVARAIAAAEQLEAQMKAAEKAKADLKAQVEKKAAEDKQAQLERQAVEALAQAMAESDERARQAATPPPR